MNNTKTIVNALAVVFSALVIIGTALSILGFDTSGDTLLVAALLMKVFAFVASILSGR